MPLSYCRLESVIVACLTLSMEYGKFDSLETASERLKLLCENLCHNYRRIFERTAAESTEYQRLVAVCRRNLEYPAYPRCQKLCKLFIVYISPFVMAPGFIQLLGLCRRFGAAQVIMFTFCHSLSGSSLGMLVSLFITYTSGV